MGVLDTGFKYLIDAGLAYLLVFGLFYAICFGLLQRIKLFGDNAKNYNAVIAFCLSFFTVYNFAIVDKLPEFISRMAIFIILLFCLLLLSGFLGVEDTYRGTMVIVVIGGFIIYSAAETFFPGLLASKIKLAMSGTILAVIGALAVFTGIIWFVARDSKGGSKESSSGSDNTSSKSSSEESPSKSNKKPPANSIPGEFERWDGKPLN